MGRNLLMLPVQKRIMQNYLLERGYQKYTIRRMQSWDLLSAYCFEKKRPRRVYIPSGSINPEPDGTSGQPRYIDTLV